METVVCIPVLLVLDDKRAVAWAPYIGQGEPWRRVLRRGAACAIGL